jgi:predicted permease
MVLIIIVIIIIIIIIMRRRRRRKKLKRVVTVYCITLNKFSPIPSNPPPPVKRPFTCTTVSGLIREVRMYLRERIFQETYKNYIIRRFIICNFQ